MKPAMIVATACVTSLLAAGPGCEPADAIVREPISGTVALDGQPIEHGLITFTPKQAPEPVVTAVIADGQYRLDRDSGPTLGPQQVQIYARRPTGKKVKNPDDPKELVDEVREVVPARYNVNSELTAEVKAGGDNRFPFELSGAKVALRGKR